MSPRVKDGQVLRACWIASLPETGMPLLGAAYGENNQEVKLESAASSGNVFLQQAVSGSASSFSGPDLHVGISAMHCPKLKP